MPAEKWGLLRNGNPRLDLRTLPCCGARTRTGLPCRQPAMRNGRCRMHGGKSTGARTEQGRAAQLAANTKSGADGAFGRRLTQLTRMMRRANWLMENGVMPGPGDGTYAEWVASATVPVPDLMAGLPDLPQAPEPAQTQAPEATTPAQPPEPHAAQPTQPSMPQAPGPAQPTAPPTVQTKRSPAVQPPRPPALNPPLPTRRRYRVALRGRAARRIRPRAIGPPRR